MQHGILKMINPAYWGDTAAIIGNRQGLEKLKQTIESALADGKTTISSSFYETDGSMYALNCRMHEDQLDINLHDIPTSYESSELESSKDLEVLEKFLSESVKYE